MTQPVPYDSLGRKRCGACKEYRDLSFFDRTKRTRDGLQGTCKICRQKRRDTNAKELSRQQGKRYWANREAHLAKQKEYRDLHAEKLRQRSKVYRDTHKEWRRLYDQSRDPEENKRRARNYYALYPERMRMNANNRRMRVAQAKGKFTVTEWKQLKEKYQFTCLCCGKREPEILLTPDHVVPIARNGSNDISNIQPLCLTCNHRKQAKTIDYRPRWNVS